MKPIFSRGPSLQIRLILALFNLVMSRLGHIAMLRSSVALEWLFGLAAVAVWRTLRVGY